MQTTKQCFRCGCEIVPGIKSGQVTIAGFYDNEHPAYYKQFVLCDLCHIRLNRAITKCLFSIEEEDNGGTDHS